MGYGTGGWGPGQPPPDGYGGYGGPPSGGSPGGPGWAQPPPGGGYSGGPGYPGEPGHAGAPGYPGGGHPEGGHPGGPGYPPRQGGSTKVAVASVIAAVFNGLGSIASVILWPLLLIALPGVILGILGAVVNSGSPTAAKVMMILSWVAFGLVVAAFIAAAVALGFFLYTYDDGV